MGSPVFGTFDPAGDRDCPGCAHEPRALPHSPSGRRPGQPAPHRTARPDVFAGEQGRRGGWEPAVTRVDLVGRARRWAARKVPHAMAGFGPGAGTASLTEFGRMLVRGGAGPVRASPPGRRRTAEDRTAAPVLQEAPGSPGAVAGGPPGPPARERPLFGAGRDGLSGGSASAAGGGRGPLVPGYPGRAAFRPGAENEHVTRLGRRLVAKGFGRYGTGGPGPRWGEADRRGVRAFQRAQGWRGGAADGHPGPETWRRLFS
ncbi:peptidoglycan-binding protein [Streptomyces pilosus]|uniref:peptidoglycan-binding protein n=1 Tax=Streptomyces pilosus TaxID=28893 RepID=UPI0036C13C27